MENTTNNDERIGAVAGHESFHGTDKQNQDDSWDNHKNKANHDVEAEPTKVEMKILDETGKKHNQKPQQ